jgi:hypothetical protein
VASDVAVTWSLTSPGPAGVLCAGIRPSIQIQSAILTTFVLLFLSFFYAFL